MKRSSSIDTPYPYPLSNGTVCTVGVQNIENSLLRFSFEVRPVRQASQRGRALGVSNDDFPAERIWSRYCLSRLTAFFALPTFDDCESAQRNESNCETFDFERRTRVLSNLR